MKNFKIYYHPHYKYEIVKVGWSWPGALFSAVWLILKKMWRELFFVFIYALIAIFIGNTLEELINNNISFHNSQYYIFLSGVRLFLRLLIPFTLGIYGNYLFENSLKRRGFIYKDTIIAKNKDHALAEYFDNNSQSFGEKEAFDKLEGSKEQNPKESTADFKDDSKNYDEIEFVHKKEEPEEQKIIYNILVIIFFIFLSIIIFNYLNNNLAEYNYNKSQSKNTATIIEVKPKNNNLEDKKINYFERGMKYVQQKNNEKAFKLFQKACENENNNGCFALGLMYYKGVTVEQSPPTAVKLFYDPCEAGFEQACVYIADIFYKGEGVKRNYSKAADFYDKACDNGDSYSCYSLGVMHENGKGIPVNYSKSTKLYQKACNGGSQDSCNQLGVLFQKGKGVDKNYTKAVKYYQIACSMGHTEACNSLGVRYFKGEGVNINYNKAKNYFKKACDNGSLNACDNYNKLVNNGY